MGFRRLGYRNVGNNLQTRRLSIGIQSISNPVDDKPVGHYKSIYICRIVLIPNQGRVAREQVNAEFKDNIMIKKTILYTLCCVVVAISLISTSKRFGYNSFIVPVKAQNSNNILLHYNLGAAYDLSVSLRILASKIVLNDTARQQRTTTVFSDDKSYIKSKLYESGDIKVESNDDFDPSTISKIDLPSKALPKEMVNKNFFLITLKIENYVSYSNEITIKVDYDTITIRCIGDHVDRISLANDL